MWWRVTLLPEFLDMMIKIGLRVFGTIFLNLTTNFLQLYAGVHGPDKRSEDMWSKTKSNFARLSKSLEDLFLIRLL